MIYKYQPQSEEKNIFISFLGKSIYESFEVYLYSNLSEINYDKEGSFTNYIEKFNNYGEIEVKYEFDIYYILIKNNWFEDEYKYLSLMIYNLKEYMDISKYNEYMLAFNGSKNIIINYPYKNISKYLYIEDKGTFKYIEYDIYINNTESKFEKTIRTYSDSPNNFNIPLEENNNYYINITINSDKKKWFEFFCIF